MMTMSPSRTLPASRSRSALVMWALGAQLSLKSTYTPRPTKVVSGTAVTSGQLSS